MQKPSFQLASDAVSGASIDSTIRSPLAELVSAHLRARGMRQIDFCRRTGFDQGLLSKILSSVVSTLNVETALKLAEGLEIPPATVFDVIGKSDVDEMLRRFYSHSAGDLM
jgi:transcriptional regulator with XRE-family HTH domain